MTYTDFGYMRPEDFERVLDDEDAIRRIIGWILTDANQLEKDILRIHQDIVNFPDHHESSPAALASEAVLGQYIRRFALEMQKVGFLEAHLAE